VIDLLKTEFADRQVLLFTHDHEWFVQLRALLPAKSWTFCKLLPWDSPEVGLRWAGSVTKLEEAREQLGTSPEIAASRARASMDEQLQVAAEQLRLEVPFLRGERNDHRTGFELLTVLVARAKKSLVIRPDAKAAGDESSTVAVKTTDELIAIWTDAVGRLLAIGNVAAHGGSVARGDAESLIESCERALEALRCDQCDEPMWFANEAGKRCQCRCGAIGWKFG
jgi:hypothetical protein